MRTANPCRRIANVDGAIVTNLVAVFKVVRIGDCIQVEGIRSRKWLGDQKSVFSSHHAKASLINKCWRERGRKRTAVRTRMCQALAECRLTRIDRLAVVDEIAVNVSVVVIEGTGEGMLVV